MKEKMPPLENNCSFAGMRPSMADLSWPPIQVCGKNQAYADLLSVDYCGSVSELSAITQYINNENRLSCEKCPLAKSLLGIAMAEMMHLQKLGELVYLLGGNVDFVARYRGGRNCMWTPQYLTLPFNAREMLLADIKSEKQAIEQYISHIRLIEDEDVNAVLKRIIKDEEYHIMLLQDHLEKL